MNGLKLLATGRCLPAAAVTNEDMRRYVDTSDEWITTRTGIRQRYFCAEGENALTLASGAARQALADSGIPKEELGCVVCATVSADYATPSLSCLVQAELGLPEEIPVLDLNAACSGFLYAVAVARGLLAQNGKKYALIIGCEVLSRLMNMSDRSTCVLFGDGAGAAVFTEGDNLKGIRLHSQPDSSKIWQKRTLMPTPYITKQEEDVPLQMRGKEVFKFAVGASTTEVEALLKEIGMSKSDVSFYMVHQANLRIIDAIKKYLDEPDEKFPVNIQDHGNSSSASCAILLDECNRKGMFKPGDILVFSAFGAGLLSAAAVLEW